MKTIQKISTRAPEHLKKNEVKELTDTYITQMSELQNMLYAQGKYSLLIVLQGMDASGKDGAIKEVFSAVNPLGCRVVAYKKPTEIEMKHDFLWRVHRHVPEKGMIQIFNRSHYEDVLIQRVHRWIDEDRVKRRFDYINQFEKLLMENDTQILKFYLHVSKKEQLKRLKERISDPRKKWKYNANDIKESERWDEYMKAYQDVIKNCSPDIPWTIVPSEQNWYKEYIIAKTIVEKLKTLDLKYPGFNDV